MRSILLGCLLLVLTPIAWGNEDVRTFIESLSEEDQISLDRFFRFMVRTINGYVIYGDKPCGLAGHVNTKGSVPSGHKNSLALPKGKELWQRLNISPYNKEYLFAVFNCNGYSNFIAINRKAFLKAVNENLPLFRYVLGPTLTAESLLQKLIDAKDDFYQVFKDDNALFGILLGYGTENALLVSRLESICCDNINDQKEEFPFLPYLMRVHKAGESKYHAKHPSLGYSTIFEEIEDLQRRTTPSHGNPPLRPYALPYFGCKIGSEETQKLIATYQKNQVELLQAVEAPDFLEKTLTKFLTTTSGEIEIPPLPTKKDFSFDGSTTDISNKLAALLTIDVVYVEDRSYDLCIRSYVEGMEQQETSGQEAPKDGYDSNWKETYDLNRDLTVSENLAEANDYFTRLAQSKKLICLIPNGIYYKILQKGRGEASSPKIKKVSFHYSYKIRGDKSPYSIGTIQEESPEHFIPGMVHTLIGMKRGEERWVAIHPRYGYGDHSFLRPNSTLMVKVQLLDFEEGDQEIAARTPHELEMKNIAEMQTRFNQLKAKKYHEKGRELWHVIQNTGTLVDLKMVKKSVEDILTGGKKPPFKSVEEAHQYSIDLEDFLFPRNKKIAVDAAAA